MTFTRKISATILMALFAFSCETSTEELKPVVNQEKVSALLDRAYQKGTRAEYDAITQAYQALTYDEIELFNKLRTERDFERVKTKYEGQVSNEELSAIYQELKRTETLRSELNKMSLGRYKVPYNQISQKAMFAELTSSVEARHSFSPAINGRENKGLACTSATFNGTATITSSGNTQWVSWQERKTPNTVDCDYEFKYPGYRTYFDPKDWFADQLCNSFNNQILRRRTDSNTYLLFGNRGVWLWEGWPGLTSVDML